MILDAERIATKVAVSIVICTSMTLQEDFPGKTSTCPGMIQLSTRCVAWSVRGKMEMGEKT